MSSLGDRHRGDLGGRLRSGIPVNVSIRLPTEPTVGDQHTAWMLINLLLRLDGVVDAIRLECTELPIAACVSPHFPVSTSFLDAAATLASNLGGASLRSDGAGFDAALSFDIGQGAAVPGGLRVAGSGWHGAISAGDLVLPCHESALPFGPYAAACLASAEAFRAVRLPADRYEPVSYAAVDLWNYGVPDSAGPPAHPLDVVVDFGLAGVGAVGVSLLHTLWACDGITGVGVIADNDLDGVDDTNLNRYVLFDRRHIGRPKATTAATVCGTGHIEFRPIDGPYDREHVGTPPPKVLLSAVDVNESRRDLQRAFAPGVAFGASTEALRAELAVLGPPNVGPCLACHNPVVAGIPDDVQRMQVRSMSHSQIVELATALRLTPKALREWAETGKCGLLDPAALGHLLPDREEAPEWSVGFVSVFAGVMLAAQTVKHALGHPVPTDGTSTKFQFHRPQASRNGLPRPQPPDDRCAVCRNDVHRQVWASHRSSM